MNEFRNLTEARLERLVDGELNADEYRALLAALETEPDGWRRCAIAFLESQALAAEFGSHRRSLDQPTPRATPAPGQSPRSAPASRSGARLPRGFFLLAIAASFLAAFSLGVVAPRFFSQRPQEPGLAGNFHQPIDEPAVAPAMTNRHEVLRPVGNLHLVMDGANGESIDAGQVPVYEAGADLEDFLRSDEAALGPELVELLRRSGFEVQHEQRYFPAPLDDGRQLIVPVDGYQIVPVGGKY